MKNKTKWVIDRDHSDIQFMVNHLGISLVNGRFLNFKGEVHSRKKNFEDADVNLTIEVLSLNTGNASRDHHLLSSDFLNDKEYPEIIFKSTSFSHTEVENEYKLCGNMNVKGVSKPICFQVQKGGVVKDVYGNLKAGFRVSGKFDRGYFGLDWQSLTKAGEALVGDKISLEANLEFIKTDVNEMLYV